MTIDKLKKQQILVLVLMVVSYFTAIRINGDLTRLPTPFLLIIAISLFCLNLKANLYAMGFVSIAILHAVALLVSGKNIIEDDLLFKDLALYCAQLLVYSLCFWSLNYDDAQDLIIKFFKVYITISIIFWVGSYLSGIYLAVEPSYSIPRAQGFVTEPSNLAHFLPALIIYFWKSSKYKWAIISTLLMFLAFSPTVYIAFILSLVILNILVLSRKSAVYMLTMVFAVSIFFLYWEFIAPYMINLGQIGEVVVRIVDGFIFIFENGATGANSRATLLFDGIEFMNENKLWWTGTGFGSSDAVAVKFNEGMLFDSNNWFSFVLWFGLPALIFLLLIHAALFVRLRSRAIHSKLNLIDCLLVTMVVSNTVNGGGVWVQQLFFVLIAFRLLDATGTDAEKNRVVYK